jgi:hypothetical protein
LLSYLFPFIWGYRSFGHSNTFSGPFQAAVLFLQALKYVFCSLSGGGAVLSGTQPRFPFPFRRRCRSFGHSTTFSVPFHAEVMILRALKHVFRSLSRWGAVPSDTQTRFPFPFRRRCRTFGNSNKLNHSKTRFKLDKKTQSANQC